MGGKICVNTNNRHKHKLRGYREPVATCQGVAGRIPGRAPLNVPLVIFLPR